MKFIDITGKKFGLLTVNNYLGNSRWLCSCECGNTIKVDGRNLKNGKTQSCGCKRQKQASINGQKNKKYLSIEYNKDFRKLYQTWIGMKRRCNSPNCHAYSQYGKRGIKICEKWEKDFISFYEWSINNGYHENLSIDRIDVNGNYEPSNCRWANAKEQQRNRRNSKLIQFKGKKVCLTELAEKFNINISTLRNRIRRKWPIEKALLHST